MLKLSRDEVTFIIKSLVEHKEKIEHMKPYPAQRDDLKPYRDLIGKFVIYRKLNMEKKRPKGTKR